VFAGTLMRLPEVGEPWLRAICDRIMDRPHGRAFW